MSINRITDIDKSSGFIDIGKSIIDISFSFIDIDNSN